MIKAKKHGRLVPKSGYFVMRDSRCQVESRCGQEIGVVLNSDYYVDIEALVSVPISKDEARRYSHKMRRQLPSREQMQLLADNLEVVNNSLLSAGRGDCLLLGNVCEDFWVRGMRCNESVRKKVVFIIPVSKC